MRSEMLKNLLLIAIAERSADGGFSYIDGKDAAEKLGLSWRSGHLRIMADDLESRGLIQLRKVIGGDPDFVHAQITQTGIEESERLLDQDIELQHEYEELRNRAPTVGSLRDAAGKPFVLDSSSLAGDPTAGTAISAVSSQGQDYDAAHQGSIQNAVTDSVPASDRVVRLDHNRPETQKLLVSLDDAIHALDGVNDDLPMEVVQRIFELKAGRAYLESPQVDLSIVEATIVRSLRDLCARTINNAVDIAINAALAAVMLFFFGVTL